MNLRKFNAGLLIILFTLCSSGSAVSVPISPFDRFGDINCEDEMARLDNLAIHLRESPAAKAVITFYGGRRFRGRLPKPGKAAARAARMKPYLVSGRGIPEDQVIVIDGGYRDEWQVIIWVVPPGATYPTPDPTVALKEIKIS
jgi:hypothetical protein